MTDFFREVDEDYRRDRAVQIWTKYQYWFIALAVLIVAGTAAWRIYQHVHNSAAEAAGAQYEAALLLSSEGKSAEAEAAFGALAKTAPKGYAALASLRAVDEIATRDPAAAIKAYAALGADQNYDQAFRDVALAREAILGVDSMDSKEFEQKFASLAAPAFTYYNTVRELLALAALKRNDFDAAGRWFDMIIGDPRAPQSMRQRTEGFLGLVQAGKSDPEKAPAQKASPDQKTPDPKASGENPPVETAPGQAPTAVAAPESAAPVDAPAENSPVTEADPEKAPVDAAPDNVAPEKAPAAEPSAEEAPAK
ncbi:MAG: tetratricopeptide repeat protein [Methylocella sp.]